MEHPGFFTRGGPFRLGDILDTGKAEAGAGVDLDMDIRGLVPLDEAGPSDLSFFDNPKYLSQFEATKAGACFALARYAERAPDGVAVLMTDEPYRCFAAALGLFYPDALYQRTTPAETAADLASGVHESAVLEDDVLVEPGAVVGPEAHIGSGTTIASGASIGRRVYIGRGCYIGANVNVTHTLIGNRVIVHAGVSIGQDGFGFAMGKEGHLKVPQIGRVIIQDDVEIGANTTVDRGALKDTIIGEGTKIDNLVQIGHNVVIGRHCVIVAQTGISGSTELEDFVVLGGQCGVVGHVKIGAGAQIAGSSNVRSDVPPGVRWGGTPAKPTRLWFRELTVLKKLAEESSGRRAKSGAEDAPDE